MNTWRERAARSAWGTALALLSPVYALKLWWRGRAEPGYRQAMLQRFGWGYPAALGLMAASAIVPMLYFRKRGWLK